MKDEFEDMADDARARKGVPLIAWEHTLIPSIVRTLTDGAVSPGPWPDDRFDMVWILDNTNLGWILNVQPQDLLPGDSP